MAIEKHAKVRFMIEDSDEEDSDEEDKMSVEGIADKAWWVW